MTTSPRGFLLIDKPRGISSYGVVETVRRTLAPGRRRRGNTRFRCGHAGTLDPLATGLLLVMCGPETRLSQFLLGHDKRYTFTIRLGATTDTLDADGETITTGRADFTTTDVTAVLDRFRGDIRQVPPVYSALKRNGRPLYELARNGAELPDLDARPVRIHDLTVLGEIRPGDGVSDVDLSVSCSSGTYVRSLARDVAEAMGTVGYVIDLRRTRIGPFEVADALPADRMQDAVVLASAMRPAAEALCDRPAMTVDAEEAAFLRQGRQPDPSYLSRLDAPLALGDLFRMLDADARLVAVGRLVEPDPNEGGAPSPCLAAVFPPPSESTREDVGSCD